MIRVFLRLILHHLGRSWRFGMLASIGIFIFQALVVRVFRDVASQPGAEMAATQFSRIAPKWMQSALGIEGPITSLSGFLTISYQHPFLLAILLSLGVATATKFLAGEVERRTMALLLCRPLGRWMMVASTAFVSAFWPALATIAALGGTYAGLRWVGGAYSFGPSPGSAPAPAVFADFRILAWIALNLYLLALAGAFGALLLSASVNERHSAADWAFGLFIGMYVAYFLVQIWPRAARFSEILLFRYYTPANMLLRAGPPPFYELQVLGIISAVALFASFIIFSRRQFSL